MKGSFNCPSCGELLQNGVMTPHRCRPTAKIDAPVDDAPVTPALTEEDVRRIVREEIANQPGFFGKIFGSK